jgi:hypothetical protein
MMVAIDHAPMSLDDIKRKNHDMMCTVVAYFDVFFFIERHLWLLKICKEDDSSVSLRHFTYLTV